jgi:transposase
MDQTEWVAAHVAAAEFYGGLPQRIVLDYVPRNIIELLFPGALCALEA